MLELLNELRVALPGVQILLGFMLTAVLATAFIGSLLAGCGSCGRCCVGGCTRRARRTSETAS